MEGFLDAFDPNASVTPTGVFSARSEVQNLSLYSDFSIFFFVIRTNEMLMPVVYINIYAMNYFGIFHACKELKPECYLYRDLNLNAPQFL